MSAVWTRDTVEACLQSISLPRVKLQTRDYRPSGTYPIVDQGQAAIAGWTDDDAGVIDEQLPVIVFGDHSRTLKYLDAPFVRGADGTQILKPRAGIDPLFFFYALRSLKLDSRGYNRHFTALKEQRIPLPDLKEQVRIAAVLKEVEDSIHLQLRQRAVLEELSAAALEALFARGLRDEPQKETEIGLMPESWRPRTVGELCEIWSGGTPRKSVPEYWGGDIPWVSGKDLKRPIIRDSIDHVTAEGVGAGTRVAPADAVLLLVRGMGLAKDLPVATISRPMAFNQDVKALVLRAAYPGRFLRAAMYAGKERLLSQIVDSAHGTKTLNLNDVESFVVGWPPTAGEAEAIVALTDAIEGKIALQREREACLTQLLDRLLHSLMGGDVRLGEFPLASVSHASEGSAA